MSIGENDVEPIHPSIHPSVFKMKHSRLAFFIRWFTWCIRRFCVFWLTLITKTRKFNMENCSSVNTCVLLQGGEGLLADGLMMLPACVNNLQWVRSFNPGYVSCGASFDTTCALYYLQCTVSIKTRSSLVYLCNCDVNKDGSNSSHMNQDSCVTNWRYI